MTKLEINDKLHLLPSKWNELTREQLLEFCRVQLLETTEDYRKILMLKHFTGLDYDKLMEIPGGDLPRVLSRISFLFHEVQLTTNLLGDIEGMPSPEPALTNFTFEQFLGYTEPYHYSIQVGKWNDVDNLLNCMYNFNGPEANFKKIKALSEVEKLAVYYFYCGCSNFIHKKFKNVFTSSPEKRSKPDGMEFIRLVNSLNLGDVSKNSSIKTNNLYESLQFLSDLIEKNSKK